MPLSLFSPRYLDDAKSARNKLVDQAFEELKLFRASDIKAKVLNDVGLDSDNLDDLGLDADILDMDTKDLDSFELGPVKSVIEDAKRQVAELVEKKIDEIVNKFDAAFRLGCTDAAWALGMLYLGVLHVDILKDLAVARTWFAKGLAANDRKCIGRIDSAIAGLQAEDKSKKDPSLKKEEVIEILKQAFELGWTPAAYKLGALYMADESAADEATDTASARKWFKQGLAAGDQQCAQGIIDCDEADKIIQELNSESKPSSPSPRR